jgi:3-methyladenine DNA glycosylase/8-oxoguanine DNA glycosylase
VSQPAARRRPTGSAARRGAVPAAAAPVDAAVALAHLERADPRLAPLIAAHGEPRFERTRQPVQALARAIVYQQLSGKAAATIWGRVLALFPRGRFPPAPAILEVAEAQLRGAGLSAAKAAALKDLARHVVERRIVPRQLVEATDEAVAAVLLPVRGIGPWSVDMFLMFSLARPDVLPVGDLGVRKGMMAHFGLRKLPSPERMLQLAAPWRPFRSFASWYMWRRLEM